MRADAGQRHWRRHLSRDIGWLLMAKLGLLLLLWALFFSGSHRCRVDGTATAQRLAVVDGAGGSRLSSARAGGGFCD